MKQREATEADAQALGTFAKHRFTLEHPDDHLLELKHEGQRVAFFNFVTTPAILQAVCSYHLVKEHKWNGVLWQS